MQGVNACDFRISSVVGAKDGVVVETRRLGMRGHGVDTCKHGAWDWCKGVSARGRHGVRSSAQE